MLSLITSLDSHLFLSISLTHILGLVSPGPDFFLVSNISLSRGQKAGIGAALGVGLGIWIHVLYSYLGITLLIQSNPVWHTAIKTCGSIYLFYLGLAAFLAKPQRRNNELLEFESASPRFVLKDNPVIQGFLCNVFNPKAALFFLSIFSGVLSPASPGSHVVLYGTMFPVTSILWFALVAYFFTQISNRSQLTSQIPLGKIFGVILMLVALSFAFDTYKSFLF